MIGPMRTVFLQRKAAFAGILLACLFLSASIVGPAESRPHRGAKGNAKDQPGSLPRRDGIRFKTGFVDSAGPGYLSVDGKQYDVSRAVFVAPGNLPRNPSDLSRGGKVSLAIRNRQVVEVVIFDPASIE